MKISVNGYEILKMRASCGCLLANIDSGIVEKQGGVNLKISVTLDGLKGKISKKVAVLYRAQDQEESKSLILEVVGEVLSAIRVTPASIIDYGQVSYGNRYSATLNIVSDIYKDIDVSNYIITPKAIEPSWIKDVDSMFGVQFKKVSENNIEATLYFQPEEELLSGAAEIQIFLNNKALSNKKILVFWDKQQLFDIMPSCLILDTGNNFENEIEITSLNGNNTYDLDCKTDIDGLYITTVKKSEQNVSYYVEYKKDQTNRDTVTGTIDFYLNDDSKKTIYKKVPVLVNL